MTQPLSDFYPKLAAYSLATRTRVPGPSNQPGEPHKYGYRISKTRGNEDDSARYLLFPDTEFRRPWLANPPNGKAFIWPLGIQGFQYSGQASLGVHHYIGDNDVDVDVVYPDELHVSLSGHFPGKTSWQFMQALRDVILEKTGETGKILSLPGLDEEILYVAVVSHNFTHEENDMTSSIAYSIEMIKTGIAGVNKLTKLKAPTVNPTSKKVPRGKAAKQTSVKQGGRTAKKTAKKVYGSASGGAVYKLLQLNANELEAQGIPAFTAAYSPISSGTVMKY